MSRKRSTGSNPTPFSSNGGVVPPLTLSNWQSNIDEPFSSYTAGNPPKIRRTGSGTGRLGRVPEISVYDNPVDFIANTQTLGSSPPSQSPTFSHNQRRRRSSFRLSVSPRQAAGFGSTSTLSRSPTTPATGSFTSATTYTSDMSRQSSLPSSFCGGFDMIKLSSQQSDMSNLNMNSEYSPLEVKQSLAATNNCKSSVSENDRSHFFGQARSVADETLIPKSSHFPTVAASSLRSSDLEEDIKVERLSSSGSTTSAQSRESRRRQEQLAQSSRRIAPKLSDDEASMSRQSSASSTHQMIRIKSADGSSKDVVQIAKTPYVRPSHEKVKCSRCNEQADGFRGEHELRRHMERAHSVVRKAFVCVDISQGQKFLANCKACRMGKKYGAYYNAAAHLRRTHFNPKQKGRKGKGKPEEKRGGKGGGDFPSMEILKMWMKEVEEFVPENGNGPIDGEMDIMSRLFNDTTSTTFDRSPRDNIPHQTLDFETCQDLDSGMDSFNRNASRASSTSTHDRSHAHRSTTQSSPRTAMRSHPLELPDERIDTQSNGINIDPLMLFDMSPFDNSPFIGGLDEHAFFPDI